MSQDKKSIGLSPSLSIALDPFSCVATMDAEEIIRDSSVDMPLLQKFLYLASLDGKPSFCQCKMVEIQS